MAASAFAVSRDDSTQEESGDSARRGARPGGEAKAEGEKPKGVQAVVEAGGAPSVPQRVVVECQAPSPVASAPRAAATAGKDKKEKAASLWRWEKVARDLVMTVIYSLVGLILALFGYKVYDWITPFDLRKELEVDQNTSLGIVAGCIILGTCIIVAAVMMAP